MADWLKNLHEIVTKNRTAFGMAGSAMSKDGFGAGGAAFAQGAQYDDRRALAEQKRLQEAQQVADKKAMMQKLMTSDNSPSWMRNLSQSKIDWMKFNPEVFDSAMAADILQQMKPKTGAKREMMKDRNGINRFVDSGEEVFGGVQANDKNYAPIKLFNPETQQLEYAIPSYNQATGETETHFLGQTPHDTLDDKTQAKIDAARGVSDVKGQSAREDKWINAGFAAAESLPDIKRSIELLDKVATNGFQASIMDAQNYLGREIGDKGELHALLAQNVLDGLSAFTGAISEGERTFIERMAASIGKGNDINQRQLRRLMRIAENAVDRAEDTIIKRGGVDMQFNLDRLNSPTGSASPSKEWAPTGYGNVKIRLKN